MIEDVYVNLELQKTIFQYLTDNNITLTENIFRRKLHLIQIFSALIEPKGQKHLLKNCRLLSDPLTFKFIYGSKRNSK